jgi:hypothetical protein
MDDLQEILDKLKTYYREICHESNEGYVMSHSSSRATLQITSNNTEHDVELVDIEIIYRIGCACPEGIRLIVNIKE